MTLSRRAARRTAFFLLYQWDLTGQPLGTNYEGEVDEFALGLARAVAEHAPELDERISEVSGDWPAKQLGTVERNVLRIGVHELQVEGIATTRDFAIGVLESDAFISGEYTTSYLDESIAR